MRVDNVALVQYPITWLDAADQCYHPQSDFILRNTSTWNLTGSDLIKISAWLIILAFLIKITTHRLTFQWWKKGKHSGTISNLQIFFGKLTNCQTTFCQPSFYPPFILPNFFCANLQFTKYILPNLHFLDFWKTYKFPSLCQIFILPNLHFTKSFSL